MSIAWEIRQAIRQEIEQTAPFHEFTVHSAEPDGSLLKIQIDPFLSRDGLDESLEESNAWWDSAGGGDAEVLFADADSDLLVLRYATARPPPSGSAIRVYPPRYLQALEKAWAADDGAAESERWLDELLARNPPPVAMLNRFFNWLRPSQAKAFRLPGRKAGFLWGPPGTGKTTTLGATVATYLLTYPRRRVLLLSTTNSAVDIALVSADRALESIGKRAAHARRRAIRLGANFRAANYLGREHLIPRADKSLLGQLARLEATRPDSRRPRDYECWRAEIDWIRGQLKSETIHAFSDYTLVAMTVNRAVFGLETLREEAPFDLMVFDEASQVSIPYALALAPLAKSCLFAGDPAQLAPVVRSKSKEACAWMGHSMFFWIDQLKPATCFLHEQSRMAAPICGLISNAFYEGKLRVASEGANNSNWRRDRSCEGAPPRWKKHVLLHEVHKDGGYSRKYRGRIRHQSAYLIARAVQSLLVHTRPDQILVLTPFRAQRNLIRAFLRAEEIRNVDVSTVHRAQGGERHTIIFDPVAGEARFLQGETGARLINVALSRAQARLILFFSKGDLRNPTLERITRCSENLL